MTTTDVIEVHVPAPEIRGAIWELGSCDETEVGIDGPAGTGKTFGILYYIHTLLLMYPGAKFLVCRKYNTDLAGSALATYRDDVLHPDEPVHYYGGSKEKPAGYIYPGGSFLAVNGLDKPTKVKSMEFDGIYINEATECDEKDIQFCRMRLRKGILPRQQLIMDFNPDAPEHFLNQRMNDGVTKRLLSRHEDNPRYWDTKTNDWTEEGRRYVLGVLGGLTGVLLDRYRYGLWTAAQNAIYRYVWNRSCNVIKRFQIPKSWPRYLAIDFGYSNPFVCKWYAVDPDGRLLVYREIYKTQTLVEDLAKEILVVSGWFHLLERNHPRYKNMAAEDADPLPREVIADHDAEDIATFQVHSRLSITRAKKTVRDGIQAVQARLRPAGDGIPRLRYFGDCLVERDQDLTRRKKPTCSIEEYPLYSWAKTADGSEKEEPMKENDHGMDTDRYMVMHMDSTAGTVAYVRSIWR
jgi:hypothetical protein